MACRIHVKVTTPGTKLSLIMDDQLPVTSNSSHQCLLSDMT